MELITIRSQILEVKSRWDKQYQQYQQYKGYGEADKKEIGKKLGQLDLETTSAEEIANIIGNDSWACPQTCNECGISHDNVVRLGEAPDYDSHTATICLSCLKKAIALFSNKTRGFEVKLARLRINAFVEARIEARAQKKEREG